MANEEISVNFKAVQKTDFIFELLFLSIILIQIKYSELLSKEEICTHLQIICCRRTNIYLFEFFSPKSENYPPPFTLDTSKDYIENSKFRFILNHEPPNTMF